MTEDLDELVRRRDPARWAAARFAADAPAREGLIALAAFDHELLRVAPRVSQPLLGEIRLAWWREALDEIFEDRPVRAHPAAEALARTVRRADLPRAPLERMIDGRLRELDPEPLTGEALDAWLDDTAGAALEAAVRLLDPSSPPQAVRSAGRAWGLARLVDRRAAGAAFAADLEDAPRRVDEALRAADRELRDLSVAAFPAVAHVALARAAVRGRTPGEAQTRLRLIWAVARGRL